MSFRWITSGEHVFAGEVRGGVMALLFIFRPGKKNICLYILKEIHSALKQTKKKKEMERECIDHIKNRIFLRHQITQTSGTRQTFHDSLK